MQFFLEMYYTIYILYKLHQESYFYIIYVIWFIEVY